MKNIQILGSTGSIGTQSLKIIESFPKEFCVKGLASGQGNLDLLCQQIIQFEPEIVCVPNIKSKEFLVNNLPSSIKTKILFDISGLEEFAKYNDSEIVISAMVGISGLRPNIWAIEANKTILLANKETMVTAGELINNLILKHKSAIIPLDSEHSAIFQCLRGRDIKSVNKIILTGSGGPFRNKPIKEFKNITLEEALNHPKWKMGPKITIDSSTLMNKGLEIFEAKSLFNIKPEQIEVIIHPESILHSAVEYIDGSIIGQFGETSMIGPIHYGLFYPHNLSKNISNFIDLTKIAQLNFTKPDLEKFPLLKLAIELSYYNDSYACALNSANEIVNQAFLNREIQYSDISPIIHKVIEQHKSVNLTTFEEILELDNRIRLITKDITNKIKC